MMVGELGMMAGAFGRIIWGDPQDSASDRIQFPPGFRCRRDSAPQGLCSWGLNRRLPWHCRFLGANDVKCYGFIWGCFQEVEIW